MFLSLKYDSGSGEQGKFEGFFLIFFPKTPDFVLLLNTLRAWLVYFSCRPICSTK